MAVDAQTQSDKKCLQLKVPTSNSSEDSGIGKRKRNIVPTDSNGICSPVVVTRVSVPVPVVPHHNSALMSQGYSTLDSVSEQRIPVWIDPDNDDAVMMDCEELESNSNTRVVNPSEGVFGTEEESGESDTQNDDIESLSDHNQDGKLVYCHKFKTECLKFSL